jgi:hypothetical protein
VANKLKKLLPIIIMEEQNVFVPGRLITDNIFIAYECVDATRTRKRKRSLCAAKLDMMKTYDRMEWLFLEEMMLKMGFSDVWDDAKDGFLGCMGQHDYEVCSRSVGFSVKLIGGLSDAFLPHEGFVRGIHYRRTYFYSVSKVSLLCFVKPKRRDRWWVFVLDRLA